MTLLATLYFNFILPYSYYYYEINLFDKTSNNLANQKFVSQNFVNNITNSDPCYLDENFIVIDKINYTNKNVYIRF